MKLLGLFFLCFFINEINGFADRRCGAQLSQMMWIICENGFNTMSMAKRGGPSHPALPDYSSHIPYPYGSNSLSYNLQFEEENLNGKNRRKRLMPGIVEECCLKPCTVAQLAQYCLPDSDGDD